MQALCLLSSPPAPALHLSHSCLSPQLLLDVTSGMSSPRFLPPGVWLVATVYLLPRASRHCGSFPPAGMHLQRTVSSKPVFAAPRYLGASPAWVLLELAARTADIPALVMPGSRISCERLVTTSNTRSKKGTYSTSPGSAKCCEEKRTQKGRRECLAVRVREGQRAPRRPRGSRGSVQGRSTGQV